MRIAWFLVSATAFVAGSAGAQEDIDALYRSAIVNSPTPVTLRLDQDAWRFERAEANGEDQTYADDYRREQLTETIRRDAILRNARISAPALARTCIDTGLSDCVPGPAGAMFTASGEAIYFQVQSGSTDLNGMSSAVILLAADGAMLKPVAWTYGGAYYDTLQIQESDEGPIYVGLSGYSQGTGSFNQNALFRWNGADASLTEIDSVSWQAGLASRLPKGLEVWKGLDFEWSQMTASSALWRESDANCCASGGEVVVSFEVKDDRLLLADLYATDRILSVAAEVEPTLLAWLARKQQCNAVLNVQEGTQPVEPDPDLRCEALASEGAALRSANAENPGDLALMDRAEADEVAGGSDD